MAELNGFLFFNKFFGLWSEKGEVTLNCTGILTSLCQEKKTLNQGLAVVHRAPSDSLLFCLWA